MTSPAAAGIPGREGGRPQGRRDLLLAAALLAIPVGEALGLTIAFDSGAATDPLLGGLVSRSHAILEVAIVMATVGSLLGMRSREGGGGPFGLPAPARWSWAFFVAHLVALSLFTWMTSVVLSGGPRPAAEGLAWAAGWSLAAVATLLGWVAIWVEPARWRPLAVRGPGLFLALGAAGLAAWGSGRIAEGLWVPLSRLTLEAVHLLLRLYAPDAVCDPGLRLVGTSRFSVEIAPACSGYEGIGLVLVLTACFLWICRRELRFPRALLLIPAGVSLIWLANVGRIATLIVIGSLGHEGLALGGFHSVAGWLAFTAVGLGIVVVARSSPYFSRDADLARLPARESPTEPYLLPIMAILVVAMASRGLVAGFDVLYPLRVVAGGAMLLAYRPRDARLRPSASWQAFALGGAAFVAWMALESLGRGGPPPEALARVTPPPMSPALLAGWLAFRVLGSALVVPVAEELAFRGYLTRRLIAPDYWNIPVGTYSHSSFVISSALFGMLHDRWAAGVAAGMIYAAALYRRGELSDAVAAHATTNAMIAAAVLITGDWSLWA
ncbi:Transmembrane exosortase (Exosortase_EpsH) [Aquisphaera giovannonii]|uniref:Transmembrane exosortase (Exosortase_EpsH) n=1 Tax=Aquisphaera giovannonii TaxID=406548 RepID=A0A5B9VTY0_9BACT|nr:exosortase E/protease, VPEID-CTERM system [Aquisphaera giovannonii]QEH31772.1 Transmembrane exosortase (Exosortase_EpsH) [Aquisphaera giovannonii]